MTLRDNTDKSTRVKGIIHICYETQAIVTSHCYKPLLRTIICTREELTQKHDMADRQPQITISTKIYYSDTTMLMPE